MQDSTTACVLVLGGTGAPFRHLLPTSMSFTCWVWSHRNVVLGNVLLYSDPALKGSSCLPARFLPVWIIQVP